MSKGNMLLGHARGKVGDLVFSRVNGQQVTRARAAVVKNPQTEAQMIQRIILNTVIQAYSRMSEICDHSFEGVPVGQQSMSVFMRRNLGRLRTHISDEVNISGLTFDDIYAFAPLGTNEFSMNPYIIATGTLPSITLTNVSAFTGASFAVVASGSALTYGDVITSLGLQRGDQLTFISQEAWTDRRAAFNYARVILDPRDASGNPLDLDTEFLDGTSINMPNPRNEGTELEYSYASGELTFNRADGTQFGAAVIVSRQKSDGTWLRSNAEIVLQDGTQQLVHSRSLQECLDMFESGSIDVANPLYLNNARRVSADSAASLGHYVYQGPSWAPNGGWGDDASTPVEIELVSIVQSTEGGSGIVYAIDVDGNEYAICSSNTSSSTYARVFGNMNGTSTGQTGTWRSDLITRDGGNYTYSGAKTTIDAYYTGEDVMINDFILWMQTKGVNLGAFVNP